jgi:hypothetical protein
LQRRRQAGRGEEQQHSDECGDNVTHAVVVEVHAQNITAEIGDQLMRAVLIRRVDSDLVPT